MTDGKTCWWLKSHVMDNIEQTQPTLRYREPLLLMRNVNGRFEDVSHASGSPFKIPMAARGAAFGDLNNDGFVDVAVSCLDGPAMILLNQGNRNNWIGFNTVGKASNRDGIGARVRMVSGSGRQQFATVSTAGSYASASDKRLHFGLGRDAKVKLAEISWPSGAVQRLENLEINRLHRIEEPDRKS